MSLVFLLVVFSISFLIFLTITVFLEKKRKLIDKPRKKWIFIAKRMVLFLVTFVVGFIIIAATSSFLSILLIVFHIFLGWVASNMAASKGRNKELWYFLGFIFGLLSILALYFLGSMKKCPYCNEMIKHQASVCRFCQREV